LVTVPQCSLPLQLWPRQGWVPSPVTPWRSESLKITIPIWNEEIRGSDWKTSNLGTDKNETCSKEGSTSVSGSIQRHYLPTDEQLLMMNWSRYLNAPFPCNSDQDKGGFRVRSRRDGPSHDCFDCKGAITLLCENLNLKIELHSDFKNLVKGKKGRVYTHRFTRACWYWIGVGYSVGIKTLQSAWLRVQPQNYVPQRGQIWILVPATLMYCLSNSTGHFPKKHTSRQKVTPAHRQVATWTPHNIAENWTCQTLNSCAQCPPSLQGFSSPKKIAPPYWVNGQTSTKSRICSPE